MAAATEDWSRTSAGTIVTRSKPIDRSSIRAGSGRRTATRTVIPSAIRRTIVADQGNPHRQTRQPSPSFAPIGRARKFQRCDRLTATPFSAVSYTNAAVVTRVSGDGPTLPSRLTCMSFNPILEARPPGPGATALIQGRGIRFRYCCRRPRNS